jgi:predicted cupin superfamily sugar epimerase
MAFYDGDPLTVYEIDTTGKLTEHRLGKDPSNDILPFCMIRKGSWFGSRVAPGGNYALVGCTVAPGFDFADFELATSAELSRQFPIYKDLIEALCSK